MGVQRGCVSECGAITAQTSKAVVGVFIARPTKNLVCASIAVHVLIVTGPSRDEIVTVPTCEHGGQTVQDVARTVMKAAV